MVFPFVHVCDLLDDLYQLHTQIFRRSASDTNSEASKIVQRWFQKHADSTQQADGVALLSALLPDLRTDKVYCIQEQSLEKIVAKSDGMGPGRSEDLSRWRQPNKGDLGDCVERVLSQSYGGNGNCQVTVEEIEEATLTIASRRRYSSPSVRSLSRENSSSETPYQTLIDLYRRCGPREAKWLTRLILKRYSPVSIPQYHVYYSYHPLLPKVLKFQDHFTHAVAFLERYKETGGSDLLKHLRPEIGVKVGRPKFFQGRSMDHCMQIGRDRRMIVERKYDGEYVQLHIDMSKPRNQQIQIFSKSGKDSTMDRKKVHDSIRECLSLGMPSCKISRECILEGELVVYSDKDEKILPFHKIRKHVNRSGSFLGTAQDSPPHYFEHLCIMFFDILLLDEMVLLREKHSERQKYLESVLKVIPGRADIVQRTTIDFSSPGAKKKLWKVFRTSIIEKEEGLVLKPDEPYINLTGDHQKYKSCCIKLKKDAIGNFEVGCFAVVGANYNNAEAMKSEFVALAPKIKWNEFFLGCLENREEVLRAQARPRFLIVATVTLNLAMLTDLINHASLGFSDDSDEPPSFDISVDPGIANGRPPNTIFTKPFVFDIKCFQFDKLGNTRFETVRFPQVTRIYYDKDFMDCLTFRELKKKVDEAREIPDDIHNIRLERELIEALEAIKQADPKRVRALSIDSPASQSTTDATTQETTQRTERTVISVALEDSHESQMHLESLQRVSALEKAILEDVPEFQLHRGSNLRITPQHSTMASSSSPLQSGRILRIIPQHATMASSSTALHSGGEFQKIIPQHGTKALSSTTQHSERRQRIIPQHAMVASNSSTLHSETVQRIIPQHAIEASKSSTLHSERTQRIIPQHAIMASSSSTNRITDRSSSIRAINAAMQQANSPRAIGASQIIHPGNSDKVDPQNPPTQFLERNYLVRAAAKYGRKESIDNPRENVENIPVNTSDHRKRRLEEVDKSPELPMKRSKLRRTNNRSADRHGVISPPQLRNTLSNITGAKLLNRLPQQRLTSVSRSVSAVGPTSHPYPAPIEDPVQVISTNASSARFATPPHSSGLSISDCNSSSSIRKTASTPPSSSPSVTLSENNASQIQPILYLPSPSSAKCTSSQPCQLARHTFYLSPHLPPPILTTIIRTLLPPHNRPFTNSLTNWANPTLFPLYFPSTHALFPNKRMLRCVLVEFRDAAATGKTILELRKWVESCGLKRSNGERESIVVVDWRILEKAGRMEGGQVVKEGFDLWKRFNAFGGFI